VFARRLWTCIGKNYFAERNLAAGLCHLRLN
jgi:hypothetical protein